MKSYITNRSSIRRVHYLSLPQAANQYINLSYLKTEAPEIEVRFPLENTLIDLHYSIRRKIFKYIFFQHTICDRKVR